MGRLLKDANFTFVLDAVDLPWELGTEQISQIILCGKIYSAVLER